MQVIAAHQQPPVKKKKQTISWLTNRGCFQICMLITNKSKVVKKCTKSRFSLLQLDFNFLGGERYYSRLTSKQSIRFFNKLLIIEYASNTQYLFKYCNKRSVLRRQPFRYKSKYKKLLYCRYRKRSLTFRA